tara:strand:- start:1289 stop:1525 length:237 start_codon:yes stop_codon:yes gene_type:complete
MFEDENFDEDLKLQILGVMYILYEHGIHDVHMGGLMRILGVPNDVSKDWDEKVFCLDENFAKYMNDIRSPRDTSQLLH